MAKKLPFNVLHYGQVASIIQQKLSTQKEFEDALLKINTAITQMTTKLLEHAPNELREFLKESMVIESLFKFNRSDLKFDVKESGFQSYDHASKLLIQLQKVWKGVVNMKIATKDRYQICGRLEVQFRPANPFFI